jgi:hypothetical protein
LRITRGPLVAKLWLLDGELVDAEVEGIRGEAAFRRILSWKSGTFENLPPDLNRERNILKPINALLLESAQAIDESENPSTEPGSIEDAKHRKTIWKLALLTREGAEFVVDAPAEGHGEPEGLGTQSAEQLGGLARRATEISRKLSDKIEAGPLSHIAANNFEKQLLVLPYGDKSFLVGWPPNAAANQLLEQSKKLVASWDS